MAALHAAISLLPFLHALVAAEHYYDGPPMSYSREHHGSHTDWSFASSSPDWWSETDSYGPIKPSYGNHPSPTTSLSGIPSYTYTMAPTTAPLPSYSNSTLPGSPSPTANVTLPACKKIQHNFPSGQGGNAGRAAAVKEVYLEAWNAYEQYAAGMDELLPLNYSGVNDWYGWLITVVDGIDTAITMGLTDVVQRQLDYIQTIDFTTTTYGPVEIFDVNIRYLGGLLSAYDLLHSGEFQNNYSQDSVEALLSQAVTLADKIAYGSLTPSGIFSATVNFTNNEPIPGEYVVEATNTTYNSTNTASFGTFILEWFRLSDLTGNSSYRDISARAESYAVYPNPMPVYPGLVGTQFDSDTGRMLNFNGGWHSAVDSFLEYLIKIYQYEVTSLTTQYKDFWLQATQSTIESIAVHPYGFSDLTFISELDVNGSITDTQDDYSCFAGGNFLLGCKLLNMPQLCELGAAATDGCHQTYNSTITGLGPLYWGWYNASNLSPGGETIDNDSAYRKSATEHGFFIEEGDEVWASFPESIESIFYAYRITGDQRWADYNWEIFKAINATARSGAAFATVNNVNMPYGGSHDNGLDSFFFAEVLKYLYLTFADPSVVSLDNWVFNTESHPLLVKCDANADALADEGSL